VITHLILHKNYQTIDDKPLNVSTLTFRLLQWLAKTIQNLATMDMTNEVIYPPHNLSSTRS